MNERDLLALRRRLEADIAAIDRVLEIARMAQVAANDVSPPGPSPYVLENKAIGRIRGVKSAMLKLAPKLPEAFDKDSLLQIFALENPELAAKVHPRSFLNTI